MFENAGRAFGEFQRQLSDYPIDSLFGTIPKFHDTYSRFLDFMSAVKEDRAGRAEGVRELIDSGCCKRKRHARSFRPYRARQLAASRHS